MTVLLPVLNITFPTDEWEIVKMEAEESREGEGTYSVLIKHLPSGKTFEALDAGCGGEIEYSFTPEQNELKEAWDRFAITCIPVIQELDKLRGYDYDVEDAKEDASDSVIGVIHEEVSEQSMFASQRNTIVREEGDAYGVFRTFKAKPYALRNVGKVKGDYWDKATKSWVKI